MGEDFSVLQKHQINLHALWASDGDFNVSASIYVAYILVDI